MIFKITKKEFELEKEKRRRSSTYTSNFTFFHWKGKYYKCNTEKGVKALKEIHQFRMDNKEVENSSLFDDNKVNDGAS